MSQVVKEKWFQKGSVITVKYQPKKPQPYSISKKEGAKIDFIEYTKSIKSLKNKDLFTKKGYFNYHFTMKYL